MAYVKFSRGLLSTYNSLGKKDPNTLYLVYETQDSENGYLYLGSKLISSVGAGGQNISLASLADVNISGELQDGMLLQFNKSTGGGQWEAVALSDIVQPSTGSNNISITDSLSNITNPSIKTIAVVSQDVYIYDGRGWRHLSNSELVRRINQLEDSVGQKASPGEGIPATGLYKEIEDLKNSILTKTEFFEYVADLSHLKYKVVESLGDIDITSDEVTTTIYLVPKDPDGYDQYFVINGVLQKIGSLEIKLDGYIQDNDDRLLTEEQKKKLDGLGLDSNEVTIIQPSQVAQLGDFIQEHQFIKSVQPDTFDVTAEGQLQLKSVPTIDLTGYVKTDVFNATVGNLDELQDRISSSSTIVNEINNIKLSITWQELNNS